MMKFFYSLLALSIPLFAFSTDYYYQGGAMQTAANWNTATDGTGSSPSDFTGGTNNWYINGHVSGTVSGTWTVEGNIRASTSFIMTININSSLNLEGDFTDYDNMFIQGSGVLTMGGTSQNLPEISSLATLQIGNTSNKFARENISVTNLIFAGTASLDMTTFTLSFSSITAGGSAHVLYTQNGSAAPIPAATYPSDLIVVYASSGGSQTIPSGCTFEGGLTISNGSSTTAAGNFTCNSTLTISGSSSLDMSTFKVSGSGTISGIGTSSFLTSNTDTDPFPDNCSFYGVQYEGAANQYIPDGTTISHNLVLSTNDTVFANGSLEVDNSIVFLGNSSLDMGTGQLTGTVATLTFSGTHYFRTAHLTTLPYPDDLDFSNTGMTVEFYGTGSQLIPGGTGATHQTIYNLVLGGSGTKQLASSRYLTVGNSGGSLTLEPGVSLLTASGTEMILNGSTVTMQANATSSGQMYFGGTLNTSNSPTISRQTYLDISSPRYFNLGAGVEGAPLSSFAESGATIVANSGATGSVWYWDATNQSWTAPANTTDAVDPAIGYSIFAGTASGTDFLRATTGTISADGTGVSNADESIALSYSDSTASTNTSLFAGGASGWGWNLIANPYTVTYDWNSQTVPSNVINAIYIWNGTNYSSFSSGIGVNGGSRYIQPGQAFWIQTSSTPGGNLSLAYSQTDPTAYGSILKAAPDHVILQLSDDNGTQMDEIAVRFDPLATNHFDSELDAHKLGAGYGIPYVYIMQNAEAYSICSTTDSTEVFDVYVNNNNGTSQLQFSLETSNLQAFNKVYLEDTKTNTTTLISDGSSYSFQHLDTDSKDRFKLHFSKSGIDIPESESTAITIASVNDQLRIFNAHEISEWHGSIIDLNGRVMGQFDWNGSPIDISSLASGVYLVQLIDNNQQFITRKIVVQ